MYTDIYRYNMRLPWWLRWKRTCQQGRRPRFNPWIGKILWRWEWPPTPVFLGESHGQRSLVGYSPCGHRESDMTEQLTLLTISLIYIYIYIYIYIRTLIKEKSRTICFHILFNPMHIFKTKSHSLGSCIFTLG